MQQESRRDNRVDFIELDVQRPRRDVRVLEHAPGRLGAERQTLLDSRGCICSMDRTHVTSMTWIWASIVQAIGTYGSLHEEESHNDHRIPNRTIAGPFQ